MIFLKSIIGRVITGSLAWIIIVGIQLWRITQMQRQQSNTGLIAVAGG